MAYVVASSKGTTTMTVYVAGLTTYAYGRTFYWYFNGVSKGSNTMAAGSSTTSPSKSISGLTPSTTYTIEAEIYRTDTGAYLATATGTATTAAIPTPSTPTGIVTVAEADKGTTTLRCTWGSLSNASTYEIQWNVNSGTTWGYSYETSSLSYTITGLSPDTSYRMRYRGINSAGVAGGWSGISIATTKALPALPTPTETSYTMGTTTASITVTSSGATYFWCDYYYLNTSGTYIYEGTLGKPATSSSATFNFTGLQTGTTYEFDIYATASGYSQSATKKLWHDTISVPKLPTPTISSITSTTSSITGYVNYVSGADTYTVSLYQDASPDILIETKTMGTYGSFTFSGLTKNTGYYLYTKCSGSGYEDSTTSSGYFIATLDISLTPWEWSYTKTSGGNFNITPAEWLSFYDKIDAVREAKGLALYGFNRTSSYYQKGQPFYYWMFRHAATAINQINGQVPSAYLTVNSGDVIYASYFATLRTALNNAIATI